ncbi:FAD-dependent oxidoreductase [Hyphococcus flavus]|uniref:FAD-dependent oxidoreductase n=1 Tax=Hyphococcus flavus TaxID=1866326 RepID=A0AAE9ZCU0_9PROT|nr:FAD-dependent oxidoreductase [Hyphococcus flavus]WDI30092.1 FAD-dependent oxidoreductase [Hyphococcus flavus]
MHRAVVIGAGQAGAQSAISLRQAGFDGHIAMFGDEPAAPYQRPPLSKAYLKGELERDRLQLRPGAFYERQNITLHLGEKVRLIDRGAQKVITEDDDETHYDKLLIATGAPARRLKSPGADLQNIFYLRTLKDSDALRSILHCDGRVVIVGAGYIGLEVAAVARQAGRDVTVLEMADRVLARVSSQPVSEFYQQLHCDAGIDLRLGAALDEFLGEHSKVTGAKLTTGEVIDCKAVLVGIGALPETTLAAEAGLEVGNGVIVDEYARTSDENIWAAGDCANFPSPRYGRRLRLESVPNAIEQAKAAGANMAGQSVVYNALPWFWSDQYGVKLQTVGLIEGHDELVVRGDPAAKRFAVWYFKDGKPLAVDAINDPASFAMGKRLIEKGAALDLAALADIKTNLKSLLD